MEGWTLKVQTHFDSAHQLEDYEGKCSRLHGHRWVVITHIKFERMGKGNITVDFGILKKKLDGILPDHVNLNTALIEANPTAEWLACELFKVTQKELEKIIDITINYRLVKIEVYETPECCVEYSE